MYVFFCSSVIVLALTPSALAGGNLAPLPATQEIADFWNNVFNGAAPYGVPPLNASRYNQQTISNCTIWDVRFDSYKDPVTNLPVRLGGKFAIPNNLTPPGPGGTFPGLVVTHSIGAMPPSGPAPDDVQGMAIWFAQKGFATLAFYMRGWGTSQMSTTVDLFTDYLAAEDGQPLDYRFTGMAVDSYQAAEYLAAQPEVWNSNQLFYLGHSGGGYAVLAGGVFSDRCTILCPSSAAAMWPDAGNWLDYAWGNGGFLNIQNWIDSQPDPAYARSLVERSLTFISMYHASDNPFMVNINPAWRLDFASIFYYGGQADTAIPPWDVAANFELADPSSPDLKAFHWSPTGGHGGPESWNRTQAWVAGHYPGVIGSPPIAALAVTSINGASLSLSSVGSQVWQYDWNYSNGSLTTSNDEIVSWLYDFGDGTTKNWGPSVSHTYAQAGSYVVTLTIMDGAGLKDSASVPVTVTQGSGINPQLQVVANNPVVVPEGLQNSFLARLTQQPQGNVSVSVDRFSGDADVSVSAGASLIFTPNNWNSFQAVILAAAQDADRASNTAVFAVNAPGMTTVDVNAQERDADARFELVVGEATTAPGTTTSVAITLVNSHAAPVDSFSISLSFDAAALTAPSAVSGPDLPGPAWWEFSALVPNPGSQMIDGSEFVQPTKPVISGTIVLGSFTIPPGTAPGMYPINVDAASVNGNQGTTVGVNGSLTVTDVPPTDGDMNCDGFVNVNDIEPLVLALLDPAAYAAQYPNCNITSADFNGDLSEDGLDIQPFADLLIGL